mgnify:CR=1 FL=1
MVLQSAYLGLSAPGLPNFLQVQGTNQGLGHNSVVLMMEAECHYFTQLVTRVSDVWQSSLHTLRAATIRRCPPLLAHM